MFIMFTKYKSLALGIALFFGLTISSAAEAHQIAPNSDASWGLGLFSFFNINGETYKVSQNHVGDPGIVTFGNLVNGVLDTVSYQSEALTSFEVQKYNAQTQQYQDVAGTVNGSFQMSYNNVNFDAGTNQIAAINGTATASGNMQISGTLDGMNINGNFQIAPSFMPIMEGKFNGIWDSTINTFGDGVLDFAMTIDKGVASTGFIDAWYHGALPGNQVSININGTPTLVTLNGDIHSTLGAPIPEPATMGLLFSGLIGGAITRKKRLKS